MRHIVIILVFMIGVIFPLGAIINNREFIWVEPMLNKFSSTVPLVLFYFFSMFSFIGLMYLLNIMILKIGDRIGDVKNIDAKEILHEIWSAGIIAFCLFSLITSLAFSFDFTQRTGWKFAIANGELAFLFGFWPMLLFLAIVVIFQGQEFVRIMGKIRKGIIHLD